MKKYITGCVLILGLFFGCENSTYSPDPSVPNNSYDSVEREEKSTLESKAEGSTSVETVTSLLIASYDSLTETYSLYETQSEWETAFESAFSEELSIVAEFDTIHIIDNYTTGQDTVILAIEADVMSLDISIVKINGEYKALDFIKRKCEPSDCDKGCRILASGCPCKEEGNCDVTWEFDGGGLISAVLSIIALTRDE